MKTQLAAASAGIFMTALFAGALGHFSRRTEELEARLEASDLELRHARTEVESLASDLQATLNAVGSKADLADSKIDVLRSTLRTHDVETLYREVLAPSVQVNGNGGVGGGTMLYSREGHTYVITAYHVVQKVVTRTEEGETRDPVEVTLYDAKGTPDEEVEGDLVAYDEKKDLALLRLETDKAYPNVARLSPRERLRQIKVFAPIYAVGCPLGHDPLPTLGEVATLHKEVNGENFWMMNAPTIFGNSGGGIFHRESRELIGVSVMICTYDGVVTTPVPHLGILVSLEAVYDWLDSLHYQFVYDPRFTIAEFERARRESVPAPEPDDE